MERSRALAPHTGKVFEAISKMDSILPFTLVGGTALSLQIGKRQSEDLDFIKWQTKKAALEHSGHKLHTRSLLNMLTTGRNFNKEQGFEKLLPVYDVTAYDIQEYIKDKLMECKNL